MHYSGKEHLKLKDIAEKLSEIYANIDEWMKIMNEQ
jgi:hypothetical protein